MQPYLEKIYYVGSGKNAPFDHAILVDTPLNTYVFPQWNDIHDQSPVSYTHLAESKDPNYAVRFSVMNSLLFYYDFDRSFAVNIFNSMIGSDLRMIASPGSWQILYREYDCHGAYYRGLLLSLIHI